MFSFDVFFECVLASLFHCFFEGRTLDFLDFSAHTRCFMRFLLNRRFWTSIKKSSIFDRFWEAKTMKNWLKIVFEKIFFFMIEFESFSNDFRWIFIDFGRPGGVEKSIKNRKNRVRDAFGVRLWFIIEFGMILYWFWPDFLKIFDQMLLNFGLLRHALG